MRIRARHLAIGMLSVVGAGLLPSGAGPVAATPPPEKGWRRSTPTSAAPVVTTTTSIPAPTTTTTTDPPLVSTTTTTAAPPTTTTSTAPTAPAAPAPHLFPISRSGVTLSVEYCGTRRIDETDPAIRRLVLVVHGNGRNACEQASFVLDAARTAGADRSTLIVSPHFRSEADVTAADDALLYWTDGGWKSGAVSRTSPYPRPWRISSFEVTDLLIRQVVDSFVNVTDVVIAGHSAGGQFTGRYAAASRTGTGAAGGPSYRFVVANPSSYLYLDGRRFHGDVLAPLEPGEAAACPGYDDYKYGLVSPYSYLRDNDAGSIPSRFGGRSVRYLLGESDTDTGDPLLDTSCEGRWQGPERRSRGQLYFRYLGEIYGPAVYTTQRLSIVAGVGHSASRIYNSVEGRDSLFS